jgi:DNA polymerase III subunit chi
MFTIMPAGWDRVLMTEIGFYHLTRSTLTQALPQLLARTLAAGQRALVFGSNVAVLDALSTALWAQPAWLPHGSASDGDADLQPIWLSVDAEPLNGARYLFLIEGAETDRIKDYERAFDMFDGNNPGAVTAARVRWKNAKGAGHTMTYWQQTEGKWQKKA